MNKLKILLIYIILMTTSICFGDQLNYVENKFGNYIVRVAYGPDSQQSVGSYSLHIYRIYEEGINDFIKGVVIPRNGTLVKCWMLDIDDDKYIEIIVWTTSAGSGSYGELDVFKFDGIDMSPFKLPIPDKSLLNGYSGHDVYDIKDGIVFRSFPIYLENAANCCPKGERRTIELDILKKQWKLSSN